MCTICTTSDGKTEPRFLSSISPHTPAVPELEQYLVRNGLVRFVRCSMFSVMAERTCDQSSLNQSIIFFHFSCEEVNHQSSQQFMCLVLVVWPVCLNGHENCIFRYFMYIACHQSYFWNCVIVCTAEFRIYTLVSI